MIYKYFRNFLIILIAAEFVKMVNLNGGNNEELTLKLFPSLFDDGAQVYHILAHCNDEKAFYTKNGYSESRKLPLISDQRPVFDDVVNLSFNNMQCVNYGIYIWLELEDDQHWTSWPSSYKRSIDNCLVNHRVLFGNYFHLTISPAMDNHSDHFYSIRVYCEEAEKTPQKMAENGEAVQHNAKTWEKNANYKFKTYTKGSTTVVFNSEERQCTNTNTYHIKVWAVHKQWLYFDPNDRPLVHYVCKSTGNGERRHISFLNHFHLQIVPLLPEDGDSVYHVQTQCHNENEQQTFKSVTNGGIVIVLHKFVCKAYDITVRKVPKNWTLQMELYKRAIAETKGALEANVSIMNGFIYIFDYEKFAINWPIRRSRPNATPSNGNISSPSNAYGNQGYESFVDLLSSSEENDEEEKREEPERKKAKTNEMEENECHYYYY